MYSFIKDAIPVIYVHRNEKEGEIIKIKNFVEVGKQPKSTSLTRGDGCTKILNPII